MKLAVPFLILFLIPICSSAENQTKVNGYTIYHNALTTDSLSPQSASIYKIKRSKGRGLVNISILEDNEKKFGRPVSANVSLYSKNLIGQKRNIPLREVREGIAIYYIADFPVGHRERLIFNVEVTPVGSSYPFKTTFQKEFYTR
tara:strand:+ start:149 stop:583 length:435 start_codon:yes stop_codon:yes gene_type:complete